MPLRIVHHPDYDAKFPANHRFPMRKYRVLMERLGALGLIEESLALIPAPAPAGWLELVHDPGYVLQVLSCAVPASVERDIGFAVDAAVSRRARLAVAGTVMAARLALEEGIACNTAGGSHHARRTQGAGFCAFNDVAVAASLLLSEGEVERVLVVDLDVHQGDGTAEIFAEEPRVFTFSAHGARNYPARKARSDLDVGLPDETGDAAYLGQLREALSYVCRQAKPDIVFYNAGVDPHRDDRLGRLALTDEGLREREKTVIGFFRDRAVPVCGVIGGGYAHDVDELAGRHAILFEVARQFA